MSNQDETKLIYQLACKVNIKDYMELNTYCIAHNTTKSKVIRKLVRNHLNKVGGVPDD